MEGLVMEFVFNFGADVEVHVAGDDGLGEAWFRLMEVTKGNSEDVRLSYIGDRLVGVDMSGWQEPCICDVCGVPYDEASGDGYCGRCPSCADELDRRTVAL
jgi:rubredoxin